MPSVPGPWHLMSRVVLFFISMELLSVVVVEVLKSEVAPSCATPTSRPAVASAYPDSYELSVEVVVPVVLPAP